MVADVQLRHVVDAGQREHHHGEADEQVDCKQATVQIYILGTPSKHTTFLQRYRKVTPRLLSNVICVTFWER